MISEYDAGFWTKMMYIITLLTYKIVLKQSKKSKERRGCQLTLSNQRNSGETSKRKSIYRICKNRTAIA